MIYKRNYYLFFILLFSVFILAEPLFSQSSSVKQKREAEHQAVINYIKDHVLKQGIDNSSSSAAENKYDIMGGTDKLEKAAGIKDRKHYLMNGNNVITEVYNYGGIGPGYGLLRNVNNGVWKGLSYIFQFCPFVAASVPSSEDPSVKLHIVSDALWDYPYLREVNPDNTNELWTFEPLPGFADPDQDYLASNPASDDDGDGKPDSWPYSWYNPSLGKYVWPGYLEQDATNADAEVFWAMDDRDNKEFPYYPFPNDTSRKGLGVRIDGRGFQWSNALAENTIFFVYTITNVSPTDLDSVYFGFYGDPDLGGGSPENTDDRGFFIPPYNYDGEHDVSTFPVYSRSMVYFWDPDMKGNLGLPLGYMGCKFLESPGKIDGIDNDGDGMIDESQSNGIDDNDNWKPYIHDVGIDGIPNTGDEGEGDGVPTAGKKLPDGSLDPLYPGEPNFELTDLDEADQIGLTSFSNWAWNSDDVSNDESMWSKLPSGSFQNILDHGADIVFIFGSGPISLKAGETKRISAALLFGEDLDDLLTTAETVQTIYNANYKFYKPPVKPTLTAVPGDKKVTLYWDTAAEESIDPITGKDFEGYVIYRSTYSDFSDIKLITDGKGSSFFSEPLKDSDGLEAKWDVAVRDEPFEDYNANEIHDDDEPYTDVNLDGKYTTQIEDWWKGYHLIPYKGRGIQYYLGNNEGLVHSFVDSNNVVNGQTYYYALVAYDHGDSTGIPPTETSKKITLDPISSEYEFDVNTVRVTPGPRAPGYVEPPSDIDIVRESGIGTGNISIEILDDLEVEDNTEYIIDFDDSLTVNGQKLKQLNYSVLKSDLVTETFSLYDTNFTKLGNKYIADNGQLVVADPATGETFSKGTDYVILYDRGSIRRTAVGGMVPDKEYTITYQYYPIYQSTRTNGEDGNSVFDGLSLEVITHRSIELDSSKSGWVEGNSNLFYSIKKASIGAGEIYPADYEITFSDSKIDSALILSAGQLIKVPVNFSVKDISRSVPQDVLVFLNERTSTTDSSYSLNEEIILFIPGAVGLPTETTWGITFQAPPDSLGTDPVLPGDGDVFVMATRRPFGAADVFSFKTSGSSYNNEAAKSKLDNVYVVPNPYVGYNEIEPITKLPGQTRGERRIYFENLPAKCTIRIYTISGDFVQEIQHDGTFENAREYWNLLNRDGFSVAYGIYFAHIDAPGVGEKIIKFALIK